jgi:predicted HAD superfamily hydrolase
MSVLYVNKNMYKTFDVFDTLLTRFVIWPDHIHWAVGRRMALLGYFTGDDTEWRNLRISAEDEARKATRDKEITLAEIYAKIDERIGCDDAILDKMIQVEIDVELESVAPIATSLATVRGLPSDHPRVFITDTYFSGDEVKLLTGNCGYDDARVFSSADIRLTKRDGHLYRYVSDKLMLRPEQIEHTGDNRNSDVTKARAAGFSAVHLRETKPTRYEATLWSKGCGGYLGSVCAGAARVARLSYDAQDTAGAALARVAPGVAGPMLTAFVLWVMLSARTAGVRRLYFLARDGQILVRIADLIQARFPLGVTCTYMMASRQALYLPSLSASVQAAIETAFSVPGSKSAGQLLSELEYPADEQAWFFARAGVEASDQNVIVLDKLKLALLQSPDSLERRLSERKLAFDKYLEEIQFDASVNSDKIAIVDLGWQGNLQLRLESILGENGNNLFGYYIDLFRTPASLEGRVACFAHGEDLNANILETFCLADHGSVKGFRLGATNASECFYESSAREGPVSWDVADQQDAICRFTKALLKTVDPLQFSAEDLLESLRPAALASLRLFTTRPDPDEADAYGSVRHAPDQTHSESAEVAPKLGLAGMLRVLSSSGATKGGTRWRRGIMARSLPRDVMNLAINAENKSKRLGDILWRRIRR